MAYEIPGFSYSLIAAEDLSAMQFRGVKIDPATGGVVAASTGGPIVGVVQNKPAEGEAATIVASGITKMMAFTAVAVGDKLAVQNGGHVMPATAGQVVIGQALIAAGGVDSEIISVLLTGSGHTVPA